MYSNKSPRKPQIHTTETAKDKTMKSNNPIPPGFHTLTPYLIVNGAKKAIDFYKKAFAAEERFIMPGPDGRVMHGEIKIGDSIVFLCDEMPERENLGPLSRGGATSSLMMYIKDVDTSFDKAVKAGCTIKMPLANQFWGDRFGVLVDPFGHVWCLSTHVEDVSPEEMEKRSAEACKQAAATKK